MKNRMNFDFQCGACLAMTTIRTRKVTRFKPIIQTERDCMDCGSTSVLRIMKQPDGIAVRSLEVKLTEKGRIAYYTLNPDKDPENVQQDGNQDNHDVKQESKDDVASDSTQALQGEVTESATQQNC